MRAQRLPFTALSPRVVPWRPLHRSKELDATYVLKKTGGNHAYFHESWGKIQEERKIELLWYIFTLYILYTSSHFLKNVLHRYVRSTALYDAPLAL